MGHLDKVIIRVTSNKHLITLDTAEKVGHLGLLLDQTKNNKETRYTLFALK